jgi:hypothetical protein
MASLCGVDTNLNGGERKLHVKARGTSIL